MPVKNIVPESGPLPVKHPVLAVVNILERNPVHEQLIFEVASLGVFNDVELGLKVFQNVQGPLNYLVCPFNVPDAHSLGFAVLCGRRACPNNVERVLVGKRCSPSP